MGTMPYSRIGRSFSLARCGCISVTCAYTLGAMSGVAVNVYAVVGPVGSTHSVCSTDVPVSSETSARPPDGVGTCTVTLLPTSIFGSDVVIDSTAAPPGLSSRPLPAHPGQSMYRMRLARCVPSTSSATSR